MAWIEVGRNTTLGIHSYLSTYSITSGPGSSVGIATGYGLDGPGIESSVTLYPLLFIINKCLKRKKNPGGARFSAPVQTDPGAHLASCTMGSGSFSGIESGRDVTLAPYPLLVPRSKNSFTSTLPKNLRGLWKRVKPT
jgi:hypothetical protein